MTLLLRRISYMTTKLRNVFTPQEWFHAAYGPSQDVRILHQDGTVHWIHGWVAPIVDAEGELARVIGVATDVTERKQIEAELRQTHVDLEHELRARAIKLQRALDAARQVEAAGWRDDTEHEEALERHAELTPREREVFDLVVRGKTNKEAGQALGIAESTVKIHRRAVMSKMAVGSVAELSVLAVRAGLIDQLEPAPSK